MQKATSIKNGFKKYDLCGANFLLIPETLEKISFYGILLFIFLTAIPYGTVDPWSKLAFVFSCCIITVLRIIPAILKGDSFFSNFKFFWPLLGIIGLAIFQIIPLNFIIELNSNQRTTLSFDVYETKNFILIFAGLILTAEILLHFTNSHKRLKQLIYFVFLVSMGSALFGFLRLMFPILETTILKDLFNEKVQFAQFVNRNHFAYLMEMNLGLLMGLQTKVELSQWQKPLYWIMTGITVLAIILTNSRGGILSMIGLCIFFVFLYFLTGKDNTSTKPTPSNNDRKFSHNFKTIRNILIFSCLFFGILVFIIAFVGGDSLVSRIETLPGETIETKNGKINRRGIWLSTIELIQANPISGVGFGAYPTAITRYDKSSGQFTLNQAHNDYLELLANGGLIGFCFIIIFIFLLVQKINLQIKSTDLFRRASCLGATTGIFGVMIHSIAEFGLHVLINALILIVLIVIATATTEESAQTRK